MRVLVVLLGVLSCLGVPLGASTVLLWNRTSCHLTRSIPGSSLGSLSFLGIDAQRLALFHAHWDTHGRLRACGRQDDPELTAAFGALCAGVFQGPDLCCREHDRCPQTISPFQYKYGVRNYRLHTISHCDCDARFQQCLQDQRDSVADLVGVAFFNLLEIPCFVLQEQEACVAWNWWGGCRVYGSVPLARLQPRTHYAASWSSRGRPEIPSLQSPALTKPPQKQPPGQKGSKHRGRPDAVARRALLVPPAMPEVIHAAFQGPPTGFKPQGAHQACRGFRHLDQCEAQIAPWETKFQLLNRAPEPLFHCNCTRRLVLFLKLHSPPSGAHVLWEPLGTTCFKLTPAPDCAEGNGCSRDLRAVRVSALHLKRLWLSRGQLQGLRTDEGPAEASKHRGATQSFYGRCLQLHQRPAGQQKSRNQ